MITPPSGAFQCAGPQIANPTPPAVRITAVARDNRISQASCVAAAGRRKGERSNKVRCPDPEPGRDTACRDPDNAPRSLRRRRTLEENNRRETCMDTDKTSNQCRPQIETAREVRKYTEHNLLPPTAPDQSRAGGSYRTFPSFRLRHLGSRVLRGFPAAPGPGHAYSPKSPPKTQEGVRLDA